MSHGLQAYQRKRDFSITPEPAGERGKHSEMLSFVIQKHAARNLHYDLRLELDGTLKSWAIPKGPSLDPSVKRMAVHVEDHPLSYADFEGVIPPGQYGAGTVIVWDRGRWVPEGDSKKGLREGKLKFELRGEKLRGHWTLVRMHGRGDERQEPWLLIKERDDQARPAAEFDVVEALPDSVLSSRSMEGVKTGNGAARATRRKAAKAAPTESSASAQPQGPPPGARKADLPLTLAPQLATLVSSPPPGEGWIYEAKFDGYRLLARIDGKNVKLVTRNGHDWTRRLAPLATALAAMDLPPCWLDGEIVAPGAQGAPDFQALQNAFDSQRADRIEYFVFDLPYCADYDLREVPLVERREVLRRLMAHRPQPRVKFSEDFEAGADELLDKACRVGFEGVIGKRRDAPYVSRRSPTWIKLKCKQRQEFVIGGYTAPQGSRSGFGALLLGIHDDKGRLRYAGKVGTGFDERRLEQLAGQLKALEIGRPPFDTLPRGIKGHWVRPKLVAELSFAQWTKDGLVRQAVFHGLRSDKEPKSITREAALSPAVVARKEDKAMDAKVQAQSAASTRSTPKKSSTRRGTASIDGIAVTHADRVIDPSTGATKLDLVRHYATVAKAMLPHLAGRPVALLRAPQGLGGEMFFQKHATKLEMPHVRVLDPKLDAPNDPLIEIDSVEALLGAAQMNVVEFHTWNASWKSIEKPSRICFDLDPGEGIEWKQIIEATQITHALLDELGLESFLKTSGGKGLHVVVPIAPRLGWDPVKDFSQAIVEHLASTLPDRFVAKSGPKNRVGRIYVDYLRNGRGATTVAAFSARAREGLPVSMPLQWDELADLRSGAQWTIGNAGEHVEASAQAWADYARSRQGLAAAMKCLGFKPSS